VPEPLGDDLDGDAGFEGQRRPWMAEVVQADARKSVARHPAVKLSAEPARVVMPTVRVPPHR
jgi:hypothetical protein